MKKQSAPAEKNSLKIVLFFVLTVAILMLVSLTVKTILMIRVSKFDGTHRFTLMLEKQRSIVELVSFDPTVPSMAILQLQGQSLPTSQAGSELGVLADSLVTLPADLQLDQNATNGMGTLFWNFNRLHANLTFYDILRLYFLAKSITLSNKHFATVRLPSDSSVIDKTVSGVFMDATISQDNVSVQVINASGVPGMANRLARVVTNMGGNVVSVATSQVLQNRSSIAYFGTSSYTLAKFSHLLAYPVSHLSHETVADVVITIGKDSSHTEKF